MPLPTCMRGISLPVIALYAMSGPSVHIAALSNDDVDDGALAGAEHVHEPGADAAREEHPRRHVAHRGALHHEPLGVGLGEDVAHAAARPERHGVEAARFRVGAALPLAVALGEHELRVQREQVGRLGVSLRRTRGSWLVMYTSAHFTRRSNTSRPAGVVTSSAMPRLLRLAISKR